MVRQTSIEVYRQMEREGLLSERRWEAYKILYEHGPMTSNEIFEHARLHGNPNYRHNTNARMTELRDLGVAQEVGTKQCSVTGRNVILWDVTDKLPCKKERELTPRQKLIEAAKTFAKAHKGNEPHDVRQRLGRKLLKAAVQAF